jgi:hypothetical protein
MKEYSRCFKRHLTASRAEMLPAFVVGQPALSRDAICNPLRLRPRSAARSPDSIPRRRCLDAAIEDSSDGAAFLFMDAVAG